MATREEWLVDAAFADRLEALAQRVFGAGVGDIHRLTGGASQELWGFDVTGGERPGRYVLRRQPPGDRVERGGLVSLEDEAAVIAAVAAGGVPVPAVAYVLTPGDGLGRGFIATRMPGEALGRRIVDAPEFASVRPTLAAACGTILAALHATPLARLPALPHRTPATTLDHLERQLRSHDEPRPVFEGALRWLREHCPAPGPAHLVHGDFRTGNLMLTTDGISAILDWEGCHLGDPAADLGWLTMPVWRFGRLDRPVGGFGQTDALLAAYAPGGGTVPAPEHLRFWQVAGMLRWGLTCMAMAAAFIRGERSIERAAVGRRASEAELELLHALTQGDR